MNVTSLHVYPLKSAAGISVQRAGVTSRGLVGDRRWMLVDSSGRFLSQREHPGMCLLRAETTPEGLRLWSPGREPLHVRTPGQEAPLCSVTIWKDTVQAQKAPEANPWLAEFMGQPTHLVFMPEESHRAVDPAYAVHGEGEVSFADAYPLLLTTTASLDDLNARLAQPVEMRRFRPSVVVQTQVPFEEDAWREVRIGGVRFAVVKPCARCVVTTLDPETGRAGKEPLRTLAAYRTQGGKVLFGQNLLPLESGPVRVGDGVAPVLR